jgi:hypothetical protein
MNPWGSHSLYQLREDLEIVKRCINFIETEKQCKNWNGELQDFKDALLQIKEEIKKKKSKKNNEE